MLGLRRSRISWNSLDIAACCLYISFCWVSIRASCSAWAFASALAATRCRLTVMTLFARNDTFFRVKRVLPHRHWYLSLMISFVLFSQMGCGIVLQSIVGWSETEGDQGKGRQKVLITSKPAGAEVRILGDSRTLGKTPLEEVILYDSSGGITRPKSAEPLVGGLIIDLAATVVGAIAPLDKRNSEGTWTPMLAMAVIDTVALIVQLSRDEERSEVESRKVTFLAQLPDWAPKEKTLYVPSNVSRLHFSFYDAPSGSLSGKGDLQIVLPPGVRVWVNGREYERDLDGGIFIPGLHSGDVNVTAKINGYFDVRKQVGIRRNRTTMLRISKLGLESKSLSLLENLEIPRLFCSLVLRSAKAHPAVTYQIRHKTAGLSESVKKTFRGKVPIEINPFPIGEFEVTFRQGSKVLRQTVKAKSGRELNLRADFGNNKIEVITSSL